MLSSPAAYRSTSFPLHETRRNYSVWIVRASFCFSDSETYSERRSEPCRGYLVGFRYVEKDGQDVADAGVSDSLIAGPFYGVVRQRHAPVDADYTHGAIEQI